jgi:hypothetical protein
MSYEKTDVDLTRIGRVIAAFVAGVAVICLAVWWAFVYFRDRELREDVRRSVVETPRPIPPEPRLQVNPFEEWRDYRESQDRILNSYEWVSREQGSVRIPVRRAMELLAQRGELR